MPRSRQLLCFFYAAVALLALVATWSQNVAYLDASEGLLAGFLGATARFWPATFATPASTSITVDIALFSLAAVALMVIEARRLQIRCVWLYAVGGLLIAISVTFPLFLIARERRLAARGEANGDLGLTGADTIGLLAFAALGCGVSFWTLLR